MFSQHYRELFIKLEGLLAEAMKKDRSNSHSKAERGWTRPSKGYSEDTENNRKPIIVTVPAIIDKDTFYKVQAG